MIRAHTLSQSTPRDGLGTSATAKIPAYPTTKKPFGGLGATTGIVDAYCYGNALVRVLKDAEPDGLLTECAHSRRDAFLAVTNPSSIMNLKPDADSQEEDVTEFRAMFLNKLNTDPHFHKMLGQKLDALLLKGFERG